MTFSIVDNQREEQLNKGLTLFDGKRRIHAPGLIEFKTGCCSENMVNQLHHTSKMLTILTVFSEGQLAGCYIARNPFSLATKEYLEAAHHAPQSILSWF